MNRLPLGLSYADRLRDGGAATALYGSVVRWVLGSARADPGAELGLFNGCVHRHSMGTADRLCSGLASERQDHDEQLVVVCHEIDQERRCRLERPTWPA